MDNKDNRLYLKGEIDIFNSRETREEIMDFYFKRRDDIVLDFKDVDFIDSTGLGILIAVRKEAENDGNKVTIENVNSKIKKIFVITELDQVFEVK
ncbi:MAG: STAS domain-containing protein [Ezakiella sp.]|nr:STAS domain-containing protein [Ezakiella sp.]MDD7762270.1 STAS domain-containing protein [Bacillota bacterium]MDY3947233.1 STAS domain-containing protein [Ezakiella sp.]